MKIDNFALTMWQTCPAKFKLSIEDHWQPRMKGAALGFGAVIHEGLAEWYRGSIEKLTSSQRLEAAIAKIHDKFPAEHPIDDYRNLNNAERLMREYAKEYPGENFQILHVEVPFTLDLGMCIPDCYTMYSVDVATGELVTIRAGCGFVNESNAKFCLQCGMELERIEYGGILDTITAFAQVLYVLEHKTTSMLGPLYFRQYETSNQVTGYCWALKELSGKRVAGANINAMCLTTGGRLTFKREMTNRSDKDFEMWKKFVQFECSQIVRCRTTGVWPYRTEQCLGKYGLCSYHSVHTLSTPEEQQRRLESDYEIREWDHELRDAQKVVE
jgi:hypothetical protein